MLSALIKRNIGTTNSDIAVDLADDN